MKFNILFKRATTMLLSVAMVLVADSCARGVTVSAATPPVVNQHTQCVIETAASATTAGGMPGSQALDDFGVYAGETGFLCLILDSEGEIVAPNSQYEYILDADQEYAIYSYYIWHGEYDGDTLHDASVYVDIPTVIHDDRHSELAFHFDNDRQPLNMAEWLRAEQGKLSISVSETMVILSDAMYLPSEATFTLQDLLDSKRRVKLGNSGTLDGDIVYKEEAMAAQIHNGMVDLGRGVTTEGTPIVMLAMFIETESADIGPSIFITVLLICGLLTAAACIYLYSRRKKIDSRPKV